MGSTIIDLKKAFLQSQIRILNTPLEPSPRWREAGAFSKHAELKDKVVQEAIYKLNTVIRHHNRTVYSAQALRHVAEQIDALFWAAGDPDPYTGDVEEGTIDRSADLQDHHTVLSLPEEWVEEDNQDASGLEQFGESARYKQLHARLLALTGKRAAQKQKLAQLKQLKNFLDPFKQPQENIQPNLVTRDGELGKELERMKVLIARIGEKISGLQRNGVVYGRELPEDLDEKKKMEILLEQRPVKLKDG